MSRRRSPPPAPVAISQPPSFQRVLEIYSNAVDRLEGAARVAHVLANYAQNGTKLAAFDEFARQLPLEVLVLKAVRDDLEAANRREGVTNS
jgi:hypothetical protein